ncbi:MAG TPA: Tim44-like domain-containing protein [Sulfuriferula sp.]|nr:Tim44-like domain-containing protein [Sulfuriferula sp.]
MRKFFALFLTLLLSMSMITSDAYAKRFGGGKSFGKQRESISQQAAPRAPAASAPAAPAAGGNRWLGPLAGLAAGGLLASLFMGHGFEGIKGMDILLMLALAGGAFFIMRAMRRNSAAPQATAYTGYGQSIQVPMPVSNTDLPMASPAAALLAGSRPDWFDDAAFLRDAKAHFIRLQAAYDVADLSDIREYTTPEVFAEISLQIQERGASAQKTDVTLLNADMLDVVTEGNLVIASVRFHGLIREEANAPAAPFDEIWNIQKSATDRSAPWFVAGIQQAQ